MKRYSRTNWIAALFVLLAIFTGNGNADNNDEDPQMTHLENSNMRDEIAVQQNILRNISDTLQDESIRQNTRLHEIYNTFMTSLIDYEITGEKIRACIEVAFNEVHKENFHLWGRLESSYQPLLAIEKRIKSYIKNGDQLRDSSHTSSQGLNSVDVETQRTSHDVPQSYQEYLNQCLQLQSNAESSREIYILSADEISLSFQKCTDNEKVKLNECVA